MDLLDINGKFLSLLNFNERNGCNITVMKYNNLTTAIPLIWKKSIKENFKNIEINKNKNEPRTTPLLTPL